VSLDALIPGRRIDAFPSQAPSGKYLTLYFHLVKDEYRPKILPAKTEIDEYSEFVVTVLNA
jgi:hypothetical protein